MGVTKWLKPSDSVSRNMVTARVLQGTQRQGLGRRGRQSDDASSGRDRNNGLVRRAIQSKAKTKTDHLDFQIRPIASETGQSHHLLQPFVAAGGRMGPDYGRAG